MYNSFLIIIAQGLKFTDERLYSKVMVKTK